MSNIGKRSTSYRVGTAGLFTLALFGLSPFVPAVAAQGHARLLGVVYDEETSAVIGSARVTVKGTGIDAGIDTWTTADGTFEFSSVSAGLVSVRVQAPGYPVIVEDVELEPDAEHIVHVVLPTVGALLEEIFVVGRVGRQGNADTAADLLERQLPGFNANQGDRGTGDSP
ncbi:MAG: carboxypeptidase-like regulatory domain-containing protein, partial [Gemmatimonadota bacterium]|nr:carboxypeptidase-like regulatory domain-containing protein [Gemmatimonadota bacterium]